MDDKQLEMIMNAAKLAKLIDKPIDRNYGDTEMQDMLVRDISIYKAKEFLNTHKNKDFVFKNGTTDVRDKLGEIREGVYAILCCNLLAYMGDYQQIRQSLIHGYGVTPEEADAYLSICLDHLTWIQSEVDNVASALREKGFIK